MEVLACSIILLKIKYMTGSEQYSTQDKHEGGNKTSQQDKSNLSMYNPKQYISTSQSKELTNYLIYYSCLIFFLNGPGAEKIFLINP